MSWGIDEWGTSPWGIAILSVVGARAVDTNTVLVTLSSSAMARVTYQQGDALNPETWVLSNQTTGDVFTILSIESASPSDDAFLIHTLEHLGFFVQTHELNASALLDSVGAPISPPTTFLFGGMRAVSHVNVALTAPVVDLENQGALRITSAGDYAEESGRSLVVKMVLRRVLTRQGGFFHLDEFGITLLIKEPVTVSSLLQMKAQMEQQIKAEPEVDKVQAILTLNTKGYVLGVLRVKLKAGTDIEEIPVNSSIQF